MKRKVISEEKKDEKKGNVMNPKKRENYLRDLKENGLFRLLYSTINKEKEEQKRTEKIKVKLQKEN